MNKDVAGVEGAGDGVQDREEAGEHGFHGNRFFFSFFFGAVVGGTRWRHSDEISQE